MKFEEILVLFTILAGIIYLVDIFTFAKKRKKDDKVPTVIDYARSFFPVLLLVLVLRSFLAEPFRIPTGSMKPTLLEGDFILVNKFSYGVRLPVLGTTLIDVGKPSRGDVVVFRHKSGKDLIKRVVGVPGDHIRYVNKKLSINGKRLDTEFKRKTHDGEIRVEESVEKIDGVPHATYVYPHRNIDALFNDLVVPPNSYFVLGDNRDNSEDSRFWGFVDESELLGRAVLTWMSWDSKNTDIRWSRIGKSIYEYQG